MDRIYFQDKQHLNKFFTAVKENSLLTWREIANNLITTRAMLDNYRSGNILLSEERFNRLLNLADASKISYFLRLIQKKDQN